MAKKGLTQAQLAIHLDVSQPTVSVIINGQHKPQPRTLQRVAEALGVTLDELWPS